MCAGARWCVARTAKVRAAWHTILIGLRGVGETVLLDHLYRKALVEGYAGVKIEAPENQKLAALLVPNLRRVLLELDRKGAAAKTMRSAFAALRIFASAFKVTVGGVEVEVTPDDSASPIVATLVSTSKTCFLLSPTRRPIARPSSLSSSTRSSI